MRCGLRSLLIFNFGKWIAFAARPANYAALTSDLVTRGASTALAGSSSRCPQEELVRKVLRALGVEDWEVGDLDFHGVEWRGCDVVKIDLEMMLEAGEGSLSPAFLELPGLETLNLGEAKVSGDLAVLAKSSRLRALNLKGSKVSGDVKCLESASELRELHLSETRVFGDLKALENARELTILNLEKTEVAGDIQALQDAWMMKELRLSETKVVGDLTALQNMSQLVVLELDRTEVAGDIKALKDAKTMNKLSLSDAGVAGDLGVLQHMWKLRILELGRTQVAGSIEALENLHQIKGLDLSGTKVTGDLKALAHAAKLITLDLSETEVIGDLKALKQATGLWQLRLVGTSIEGDIGALQNAKRLKKVDLSKSKVSGDINSLKNAYVLSYLDISGTSIGGSLSAWQLNRLETFKASRCHLDGAFVGSFFESLVTVDLSSTQISRVESIPSKCRTLLLAHIGSMSFAPGLLRNATKNYVFVDLRNVTFTNQSDAEALLDSGAVTRSSVRTSFHNSRGFACYDLLDTSVQVSPEKFAPERLCTCMPGWRGEGTNCVKCPADTFKENFSDASNECIPCPPNSTAPEGSTMRSSCGCNTITRKLYEQENGTWTCECPVLECGCPVHEALDGNDCVKCSDRNLDCPEEGTDSSSAQPLQGFVRLSSNDTRAYRCLKPEERCIPGDESLLDSKCHENYAGTMCMECREKSYLSGNRCEQCPDWQIPEVLIWCVVAVLAVAVGAAALLVWNWMGSGEQQRPSRHRILMQQLKAQAPLLLQMCQLWVVLAAIASQQKDLRESYKPEFWEAPYVGLLQLSVKDLQGALNLECRFDGATVRFILALAAPVFPLLVLLCCLLVEMKRGLGIAAALQALTLLYVGGASSTFTLLRCQEKDGDKVSLPKAFRFRISMPYILCEEKSALKSVVDLVGCSAGFVYAVLIPLCLLYLYLRQRAVLLASVRTIGAATGSDAELRVRVHEVRSHGKVADLPRRLAAAAAAYIAVLRRGRVQVQFVDGTAVVKSGSESRPSAAEGDLTDVFETKEGYMDVTTLKCRIIAEMLTERVVLESALQHDRVLSGAKNLLLKYTFSRNIWMEILQKLVAVALVAIVSKIEGPMMPVAVTLVMAATSAMVHPYSQPQVNILHCFSFLCLAASAVSFAGAKLWSGRIALAAPFALSALQALRPDSAEALAIRLWEDLEGHMDTLQRGEVVELTVETYRFL